MSAKNRINPVNGKATGLNDKSVLGFRSNELKMCVALIEIKDVNCYLDYYSSALLTWSGFHSGGIKCWFDSHASVLASMSNIKTCQFHPQIGFFYVWLVSAHTCTKEDINNYCYFFLWTMENITGQTQTVCNVTRSHHHQTLCTFRTINLSMKSVF